MIFEFCVRLGKHWKETDAILFTYKEDAIHFTVEGQQKIVRLNEIAKIVTSQWGEYDFTDEATFPILDAIRDGSAGAIISITQKGRGHCSGYLLHLTNHYDDLADYTMFLQGNATEHWHEGVVRLTNQAMHQGSVALPFVHLNRHRTVF